MKKILLTIAAAATVTACGNDDKKSSESQKTVIPEALSLNGFEKFTLTTDQDQCDGQKDFLQWFVNTYAKDYSVEYTSCIHPLSGEGPLPKEFDSVTPKCTGASWCSYLTAKLSSSNRSVDVAISLSSANDGSLSGSVVTASDDPFQMLFPDRPETETYVQYVENEAGCRELPRMFITYAKALKMGLIDLDRS